mmetsp:Transcript_50764/g.121316  ORF Transcript_50764/g.121316 Transcript_50764/m.121316 type:complete len:754 (-) Transcript_50764:94-2355(-)
MDVEEARGKPKFRGKLYILSKDSAWQEAGIGHASVIGTGTNRRLQFKDEESGKILHDRPVFAQDVYQLQGEGERKTIIVWEDQEDQKDWALSFQDDEGSTAIYRLICHEPDTVEKKLLLPPKLPNLAELARKVAFVNPSQREAMAAELMEPDFLAELRETFHSAEDLSSHKDLGHIFQIVKRIFLLSTPALTERYLAEDVFDDVLGMLEFDETLPPEKRIPHRQVIKDKVKFNDVVSFEDEETLKRIHLNYRLLYLKDIVLPRALDDGAFASLVQLIHKNLAAILEYLQKSDAVLGCLMDKIRQQDMQSLLFLQDACRLSKQIAPELRQVLYVRMANAGLFDALAVFFSEAEQSCADNGAEVGVRKPAEHPAQHHAVEVLLLHATCHPAPLRNWLTKENNEDGRRVLRVLTHMMVQEEDQGVQGQIAEMLRAMLDPATLEGKEQDKRLDVFYEQGAMDDILAPLREKVREGSPQVCFAQQLVCEIVAFAVVKHGYRAKVYVIRHGLGQQVCKLLFAPQKYLQLAAVRVLRAIIGTKDEAYLRYVSKNNLLAQLLQSFERCIMPPALGTNLMASATLELLEFIRLHNLKPLVENICKNHAPLLQRYAGELKPLEMLMLKYQQNLEKEAFPPEQHAAGGPLDSQAAASGRPGQRRVRSPGRDDSAEDDSYFESLDDDPDEEPSNGQENSPPAEAGAAGLPGLLGGYADEEKDEASEDGEDQAEKPAGENSEKSLGHVSKRPRTTEPEEASEKPSQ